MYNKSIHFSYDKNNDWISLLNRLDIQLLYEV